MALRLRTITGTIVDGKGNPIYNSVVRFKLTQSLGYTSTHIIADREFETLTSSIGVFSVQLWCDDDSLKAVDYDVLFPVENNSPPSETHSASISLSYQDGSSKDIGTLIAESTLVEEIVTVEALSTVIDARVVEARKDVTTTYEIFDDFLTSVSVLVNKLASAGGGSGQSWSAPSGVVLAQDETAWGIVQANHGTGSTSRLDLVFQSTIGYQIRLGNGSAYEYVSRFQFANLSSGINRYITFDGFFDSDTTDPAFNRGVLFRYSDDINGGKFQCVCRSAAGVETLVDSGITPVIDTWYVLKVRVNSTGTEAKFFVNGTLVATITTNIAIGDANRYTAESNNDRTIGTVNFISRRFDYIWLKRLVSTSRTYNV